MNAQQIQTQTIQKSIPVKKEKLTNIVPESEYKNTNFNENQLKFIDDDLCDAKLIGVPGGGKTRVLIEKINRNFDKNVFTEKTDYLILTFSRMACNDFIVKGNKVEKRFNKNNVKTLHSLAGTIVTSILNRNSSSIDTIIVSATKILENPDYHERVRKIKCIKDIKAIFVDESQDISEIQYNLILRLKDCISSFVIFVGDPNQNIYQFQGGSDRYMLDFRGKTYALTENYRSTPNIVSFVNQISPHKNTMIPRNNQEYNPPVKIFADRYKYIERDLLNEIQTSEYALEDIAIIGPVKLCKPSYGVYTNIGLSMATNLLAKYEIPFVKHYDDSGDDNNCKMNIDRTPGHVNILTIHGSKGLEFKKVILLNFHFHTYGRRPTIEAYNQFKYLWYVAASRAEEEMKIYIDRPKNAWLLLRDVNPSIYEVEWATEEPKKLVNEDDKFDVEYTLLEHSVTDILKQMTPEQMYELENMLEIKCKETDIYKASDKELEDAKSAILEHDIYGSLYGKYVETMLEYLYFLHKDSSIQTCFTRYIQVTMSTIVVPMNYINACKKLLKVRLSFDDGEPITLDHLEIYKQRFDDDENKFYDFLRKRMDYDYKKEFYIDYANDLYEHAADETISLCKHMIEHPEDPDYIYHVFRIVLFYYQKENEMGYLWKNDFRDHIDGLQPLIDKMEEFVKSPECENLEFWKKTMHPNLPIRGEIDIVKNDTEIIDIKFTKAFHNKHAMQVLMYYNNIFPRWDIQKKLTIWNFYLGKKYDITIMPNLRNYDMLKFLCRITDKKMTNTLFLYDLETTGLNPDFCEITDRYFEEYNLGFSPSNGLLKIRRELPKEITEITGITKEMLQREGEDIAVFDRDMKEIYRYCEDPTFMAHNGITFDHRVMKANKLLPPNAKLMDSKLIIRLINADDTMKMRLSDIYKNVMGMETPYVAHRAEPDVKMMVDILRHLEYDF